MGAPSFNLSTGQLAERKQLITVVEWQDAGSPVRQVVGVRTEDSSIELNPDIQTMTDILGITYTDINKTEPAQSFDSFYILGGSQLAELLDDMMYRNAITEFNQFSVYIVRAYIDGGAAAAHAYRAEKHTGCTVIPSSIGGSARVNMPISINYSNNKTLGAVDKLSDDFVFTAAV